MLSKYLTNDTEGCRNFLNLQWTFVISNKGLLSESATLGVFVDLIDMKVKSMYCMIVWYMITSKVLDEKFYLIGAMNYQ